MAIRKARELTQSNISGRSCLKVTRLCRRLIFITSRCTVSLAVKNVHR